MPARTSRLAAWKGEDAGATQLCLPLPTPLKSPPFLSSSDKVERDLQFLFGDKRFRRVRVCILIRFFLLLLLLQKLTGKTREGFLLLFV